MQIKDYNIEMLCYSINSLDALDKLKEANYYTTKEEAYKKALKPIVSDSYDFF